MKDFFKFTMASLLGSFLMLILFFLVSMLFIGIIASSAGSGSKEVDVKENSILHITLTEEITDRASDNPLSGFDFTSMSTAKKLGMVDIISAIKKAETDNNIKGIYLDMSSIPAGISTVYEIRNALLEFKKSGKFIISYGDVYTQKSYYLATVAEKMYMNPAGDMNFVGLSSEIMFFKKALEKFGVEPEVIRHGKFKSAVEPFLTDKMSDENRLQTLSYVGAIWNEIVKGISEEREISVEELNKIADSVYIRNGESAVKYKMLDSLKYKDEIVAELKQLSGIKESDDLNLISLSKYMKTDTDEDVIKDKIAVIYASGGIDMGEGDEETIGSDGMAKAISDARKNKKVKAIVLRINSPGGSALASEIIWREVMLAKKEKPVIVSMGDVAASGGYYIACPADTIVANPVTITGSIGVFGLLYNVQKLVNDIGITTDRVNTNAHSDMGNMMRKMTPDERAIIQQSVEDVYGTFISRVAEGRKMTTAQVDSIGQGRVWAGTNAKEIGLVDVFGGINTALDIAAKKAKLDKYRIVEYPKYKDPFDQILEDLQVSIENRIIKNRLGASYMYYKQLEKTMKINGIQTRMPYDIILY